MVVATVLALTRPAVLGWSRLVAGLILIILFIPIRRYTLPGSLPFQLEPYRLFVAVLVLGWFASLLVDQRTRFRRTGFEGPLLLIVGSALASIVANPGRVAQFSTEVNKSLMFLLSYVLVVYVITSVVRRRDTVDYLAKTLVAGGGVVALLAIIEARSGFNLFNHLSTVMPFLHDQGRCRRLPATRNSQTSCLRLRTAPDRAQWRARHARPLRGLPRAALWAATLDRVCAALGVASSATVSRTGILMFVVVAIVFLWLRPGRRAAFGLC